MYNNVNLKNGKYGYDVFDDKGKLKYFDDKGKAIFLDEICQSIETGDVTWRVSFDYLGKTQQYEFPRDQIADKKLVAELQGKGADVTARTFNCFVDSMRLQEDQFVLAKNTFQHLGWMKIPRNGKLEYHYRCTHLIGGLKAEYTGNLVLKPNGSLEGWKSMVEQEVLGRPQLETITLAALSAPIVGIHGINTTTENPIYHISYRSGRGKSTAAGLAASVSGEPFEGMRIAYDSHGISKECSSIYGSWGATPKATISSHAGNRGVVVVLNELGKFVGNDMTTVVFNLSEGSDIKRLNTKLQTLVTEGFNTVFISNGEMSLIGRCKSKLEGIRNRVMEISMPMTEDADHARRIHDGCAENNGFAAPMIAKYIIENGGYDMIQQLYKETLRDLTASAPKGISGRFIEKFPTFLVMAAKLAEKALGIQFNVDSVVSFCYECATCSEEEESDIGKSFDEMIEWFDINEDCFYNDKRSEHVPKTVWGRISHFQHVENGKRLVKEYWIYPEFLRNKLKEKGYPNPTTELKIWREKGVLSCDEGHLTKKVRLHVNDANMIRMYVLQIWQDVPNKKKRKVHSSLLASLERKEESEEKTDGNADGERDC